MAEKGGDTFLTDMLFKKEGKTPTKPPKTKPSMSAKGGRRPDTDMKGKKDDESAIDSDELQDQVYDMDYGKSVVQRADDYLNNTDTYGKASFISANKQQAFDANPRNKLQKNKERLGPAQ